MSPRRAEVASPELWAALEDAHLPPDLLESIDKGGQQALAAMGLGLRTPGGGEDQPAHGDMALLWARYADHLTEFVNRPRPSQSSLTSWLRGWLSGEMGPVSGEMRQLDETLASMAASPSAPTEGLLQLVEHRRWRASPEPSVAARALAELLSRWARGQWRPTGDEVMQLLTHRGDPGLAGRIILRASHDPFPIHGDDPTFMVSARGRATVLDHPEEWPTVGRVRVGLSVRGTELQRAARSTDRWIRLGVAENLATPAHVVDALCRDSDRDVRLRARRRANVDHGSESAAAAPGEGPVRSAAGYAAAASPAADARPSEGPSTSGVEQPSPYATWVRYQVSPALSRLSLRTRIAIAAHAGVPPVVLAHLAMEEPDEVRIALRANASTPAEVQALLGPDPAVVDRADAAHPMTSRHRLRELSGSDAATVRALVASSASAPPELLVDMAGDKAHTVRSAVAGNLGVDLETLERLARDDSPWVREAVAQNPLVPGAAIRLLAADTHMSVRQAIAQHPHASEDVLRMLAGDQEDAVRRHVARRVDLSLALLIRLSRDAPWIRETVARNPTTPEPLLLRLVDDWFSPVLGAVAGRRSLPPALVARLAAHPDLVVPRALADNDATPPHLLRELQARDDYSVAPAATRTLARPHLREASSRRTPRARLALLAGHEAAQVRAAVARNPATTATTLEELALDQDQSVQREVARNPATPQDVLSAWARRPDLLPDVSAALARNPATPPDALAALFRPPLADHRFVWGSEPCFHLAANPRTPPEVLLELIDHPDGGFVREKYGSSDYQGNSVRVALARNPASPDKVLRRLAELGVGEILERDNVATAHVVALCATRKAAKSPAVAEVLVRALNRELTVDAEVVRGLAKAGGDARRLLELLVSDPDMPLESVACAAALGTATKALLNVPSPMGGSMTARGAVAAVLSDPDGASETVRLRAAACATPAVLRAAARSADPILRWGAAASPRAGMLLAELAGDPDPRVSDLALQRIARALVA